MSRPERVLVLTTSYPRHEEDPSGHFVRAEARALARGGANVHVVAPGPRGHRDEGDGISVHRVGGEPLFAWPGAVSRARQAPWRLVHALPFVRRARARARTLGRVDRAIAHWLVPGAWPLGTVVDGPMEAVAHGADVRLLCALPAPLRTRLVRAVLEGSNHVRFVAAALREQLARTLPRALRARLERTSSIRPVSLDLPKATLAPAVLRARAGIADDRAFVVTVGRLVPSKRVDLVLRAVYGLDRDLHLVIVGDGPESESLERLATSLAEGRGARTTFLGRRPRSETIAWIRGAEALIHASALEGAPTVVREARAVGTPVVACDAGDLCAWAETDSSIRIAPPEPTAMASALQRVLDAAASRTG